MSDRVFITWVRNSGRARDLAAAFQPPFALWEIEARRLKQQPLLLPLRYLEQARVTWKRLHGAKPRVIFVQSPPVFAGLVVALYARGTGARWVVDLHSSPFNTKKWGWSLPLQRWLAARATATLVHGEQIFARTRDWTGRVINSEEPPAALQPEGVVQGNPVRETVSPCAAGEKKFRVQVISNFLFDEPLPVVLEAARQLPDVVFHITGDFTRAAPAWVANPPANVTFTGFLPWAEYFAEMASAGAVMVLTTRADAMQLGAWEAMYLGQPLILSDQPALRRYYRCGAVFVRNTAAGIAEGVRRMQVEEAQRRVEIQALAQEKRQVWERQRAELEEWIAR